MGGANDNLRQGGPRSVTHANAPLTPTERPLQVERVVIDGRPIAHVAAEADVARATLSKWVAPYRDGGEDALVDYSSAPANRPGRIPVWVVETIETIETWRRDHKWSARRIARELAGWQRFRCCVRTVTR